MFKVKPGYINQDKINAVFCAIVCKEGKPYRKSGLEGVSIPLALMQMRWNGQLGFPGGKVDEEDKYNGVITSKVLKEVDYFN